MSYQIITRITITSDLRVMVRMAANNIRPLDFRYDEVVSLTETLRTKGRPTLELELHERRGAGGRGENPALRPRR